MPPPTLIITGKKKSGKTRLLCELIPSLKKRGLKIGMLKHVGPHAFDWDKRGKDSYHFWEAGADGVGIIGPEKYAAKFRTDSEIPPGEFIETHYSDFDLVLIEGFKRSPFPRIEVVRSGISTEPMFKDEAIAFVSDVEIPVSVRVFPHDDINGVADFIMDYFNLG